MKHIEELKLYCDDQGWYLRDHLNPKIRWWNAERDFTIDQLLVLAYGGGTQSTAMLILIKEGYLPKPDLIIHSDTGSELPETVEFIQTARQFVEDELNIPFAIVKSHRGNLHDDYLSKGNIPIIGTRSCTANFKILPQRRLIRKIVGRRNRHLAKVMLGITTDESKRKTESEVKWCSLEYPLIDDFPYTRDECITLNGIYSWDVGKSGCFCCPYQGGKKWLELKNNHPHLFEISVMMEEKKFKVKGGKLGLYQERPLSDLDNITLEESMCDSGAGCFI